MSKFNIADLIGTPAAQQQEFLKIDVDNLMEHYANRIFPIETSEVEALADSIELNGLQQPPLVTPNGDGTYTIISGHRRVRAAKVLMDRGAWNGVTITCKVQDFASPELAELALLTANTETRRDNSWMVPAAKRYMEICVELAAKEQIKLPKFTMVRLAEAIGVKKSELARQMFIDKNTTPDVKKKFGRLPTDTAYVIASLTPNCQKSLAINWIGEDAPRAADMRDLKESWGEKGVEWFSEFYKAKFEAQEKQRIAAESTMKSIKEMAKATTAGRTEEKTVTCLSNYAPSIIYAGDCHALKKGCYAVCCRRCEKIAYCNHVCETLKKGTRWDDATQEYLEISKRIQDAADAVNMSYPVPDDCKILSDMGDADLVIFAKQLADDYDISMDYIYGLSDEMFRGAKSKADAIEWKPLNESCKPEEGQWVVILSYAPEYGWDVNGTEVWKDVYAGYYGVGDLAEGEKMAWAPVPPEPTSEAKEE